MSGIAYGQAETWRGGVRFLISTVRDALQVDDLYYGTVVCSARLENCLDGSARRSDLRRSLHMIRYSELVPPFGITDLNNSSYCS